MSEIFTPRHGSGDRGIKTNRAPPKEPAQLPQNKRHNGNNKTTKLFIPCPSYEAAAFEISCYHIRDFFLRICLKDREREGGS